MFPMILCFFQPLLRHSALQGKLQTSKILVLPSSTSSAEIAICIHICAPAFNPASCVSSQPLQPSQRLACSIPPLLSPLHPALGYCLQTHRMISRMSPHHALLASAMLYSAGTPAMWPIHGLQGLSIKMVSKTYQHLVKTIIFTSTQTVQNINNVIMHNKNHINQIHTKKTMFFHVILGDKTKQTLQTSSKNSY